MEIVLAEHAGFCFGVRRAIERAVAETAQRGRLYSQGPLIHNRQAVDQLREQGLEPIEDIDDAPPGATVMLRTHGVGPTVYDRARERGLEVIDTTCPFVARAQREAARLHKAGYQVLVLGEPEHPEAQAIREHTGGAADIVQCADDLIGRELKRRIAVVCQTTQRVETLQELVRYLIPKVSDLAIANTICDATTQRQEAALQMARGVDMVVVIGGRHSANTTRLAQICADAGKPTHHIETAEEVDCAWLEGVERVGVTAGASTPDEAVRETIARLEACARERGD